MFSSSGAPATNVPGKDFPLLSSLAGLDCTQISFYSTTFSVEKDFSCVNRVSENQKQTQNFPDTGKCNALRD